MLPKIDPVLARSSLQCDCSQSVSLKTRKDQPVLVLFAIKKKLFKHKKQSILNFYLSQRRLCKIKIFVQQETISFTSLLSLHVWCTLGSWRPGLYIWYISVADFLLIPVMQWQYQSFTFKFLPNFELWENIFLETWSQCWYNLFGLRITITPDIGET